MLFIVVVNVVVMVFDFGVVVRWMVVCVSVSWVLGMLISVIVCVVVIVICSVFGLVMLMFLLVRIISWWVMNCGFFLVISMWVK